MLGKHDTVVVRNVQEALSLIQVQAFVDVAANVPIHVR